MIGNRYRLIGRVLALAVLVAQFGAGIHVYSHSFADPTERQDVARDCGTCLATAQLQAAIGATAPALPVRLSAWVATVTGRGLPGFHPAPFTVFRSRAPPALV